MGLAAGSGTVRAAEDGRVGLAASRVSHPGEAPVRAVLVPAGIERASTATGLGRARRQLDAEDDGWHDTASPCLPTLGQAADGTKSGVIQMPSM